ncbi:hypothetical protein HPB50_003250 [Hyalomma asiaticum]|uniref:Uncharacterized protein n=1 Tax=Hyalomma asiaticum TaxID=266040 RepID=A0ACB7RP26_HYAAI|nr:hypothetical protein HPB50_003250 [Hyalomma asiaticum]
MSAQDGVGQPLKILNVDGRSLALDEHGLARLLLDERVKDKPVVVIAVAGAFRKGKSFLLCFLLRYLRNQGRADWLGNPDAPLEGFDWQGGSKRHTTGILMWNEVFLVKNSRGEELAVVLMDTQGTFDCQSSTKVHSSIFALSAMISSVLIYNISQNIQEDHLQHLQAFIEYGMLTQVEQREPLSSTSAEAGCTRPLQSLLFLVRDWPAPYELPYGLEGGQELLEQHLKVTPEQDEELRQLRQKIFNCFTKIFCFLMPHPGEKVAQTWPFDGRLSEIGDNFKRHLAQLVLLLLEPDNLLPKEINGRKITCQELMSYIRVYVSANKEGRLRNASSMLEVTHVASCRAAVEKCLDFYITGMLRVWQSSPGEADCSTMLVHHERLKEEAVRKFLATPKMGGDELSLVYLHELTEKIDDTFDIYCKYLEEKRNRSFNTTSFKTVAFKVAHVFMTAGLAAGAVALAVVELPAVAIALATMGAASLSAHIAQVVIEMERAKRKREERQTDASMATGAAESNEICTVNGDETDDEAPLVSTSGGAVEEVNIIDSVRVERTGNSGTTRSTLAHLVHIAVCTESFIAHRCRVGDAPGLSHGLTNLLAQLDAPDDCISLLSTDFPEFERVPSDPPFLACDEVASTEMANSEAFARALKHYDDGMQQVCGESVPRLSEKQLKIYHDRLRASAEEIFVRGCYSTGKRVLRDYLHRLANVSPPTAGPHVSAATLAWKTAA